MLFARRFGQRHAGSTARRPAGSCSFVYVLIALLGGAFLYIAYTTAHATQAASGGSLVFLMFSNRTAIQALIFLALGGGGLS